MRSRFRTVVLVLVGALALSGVTVASASAALPEFQQGGKGLEKTVTFSTKGAEGGIIFHSKGGALWGCTSSTVTGETHGATEVADMIIKFRGCGFETHGTYSYCKTSGAETGEMVTAPLSGRLGYLSKESKEVGLLLEQSTGAVIITASCAPGSYKFYLKGSVIGRLTPTNKETAKFTLEFIPKAGEAYRQRWSHFEGEEAIHGLESSLGVSLLYEQTGIETTFGITSAETMEIKA